MSNTLIKYKYRILKANKKQDPKAPIFTDSKCIKNNSISKI